MTHPTCSVSNLTLFFAAVDSEMVLPELRASPFAACSSLVAPVDGEPTILRNARLYASRYGLLPQMRAATSSILAYGCLLATAAPYSGSSTACDFDRSLWRLASDFVSLAQLYHPRPHHARISVDTFARCAADIATPESARWELEHGTSASRIVLSMLSPLLEALRSDRTDLPGPALIDDARDGVATADSPCPTPSPPGGSPQGGD